MLVTPKERALFKEESVRFNALYREALQSALQVFEDRAVAYDADVPIWLRVLFPDGFISELVAKSHRCSSAMDSYKAGRITEEELFRLLKKEVPDIINYAVYLRATINIVEEQSATSRDNSAKTIPVGPGAGETVPPSARPVRPKA